MPVKQRAADRGTMRGRTILGAMGAEIRLARQRAGLSLELVGRAAALSAAEVSRIERARAEWVSALHADAKAKATFDKLSNSVKGYHVSQVTGAKTDETRQRRIQKSIATLHEGKPR